MERPAIEPAPQHKYDIPQDAESLRDLLFEQDRELLEAANALANKIASMPADPDYPDTEPRTLIVGGFVRDAMLGLHPKDADMEVYGVSPERLEQLLEQLFPGRVNEVGRSFGVYKINIGEGLDFDISIPRWESKTGPKHGDISVTGGPGMSVKEAARRRDFTMNALAGDALTGEIIDSFGGLDDLRAGVLRVTDAERFQDDPLRVYRAVQFAARLDLTVEPESLKLMQEMVERGDLDHLSKERVSEEMKKLLLKAEKPSIGFECARELGIIQRDYPELDCLIGMEQEEEWHPEGDVWVHTMMVVDAAAKIIRQKERGFDVNEKLQVMAGALCHDLGKPATTELEDGRIRSKGHEEAGEEPTKQLLDHWSFGTDVERAAVAIARHHLKPSEHAKALESGKLKEKQYANIIRKLIRRLHPVSWRVFLAASEADSRGRATPGADTKPYKAGELFAKTVEELELDKEPTKPLIQGRDLIALGVKPGREMGAIIKKIEELRDEGVITTKEEALREAKKIIET